MEVLSQGRYRIKLEEPRDIVISFGLRTELCKIITKKQLDYHAATKISLLEAPLAERMDALKSELAALQATEQPDERLIASLNEALNDAYNEALESIQLNQQKATVDLSMKLADLTDETALEFLAALLTERDLKGAITKRVTVEELQWSGNYVEYQEELLDLIGAALEYITAAIKKLSGLGTLIAGLPSSQK